jgi:hypothetical protein
MEKSELIKLKIEPLYLYLIMLMIFLKFKEINFMNN